MMDLMTLDRVIQAPDARIKQFDCVYLISVMALATYYIIESSSETVVLESQSFVPGAAV
jgi:hypothetical protein